MADVLSTVSSEDLLTIAGGTVLISSVLPATHDEAGFTALTFTEVGGVSSLPQIGGSANVVSFDLLSTGYTTKKKGQKQFGSVTFDYATSAADAGQVIMAAAALSQNSYAFKILYNDGSLDYVTGLVMGAPKTNGTADTVQANSASVEWTSTEVAVAAV